MSSSSKLALLCLAADENDPAEKELRELMIADDAAMDEVDGWIKTNSIPQTNAVARTLFNQRIHARFYVMRKGYEDFLQRHPNSARGYMEYGSFLNDIGEEDAAVTQYENAKQIDPSKSGGLEQPRELLRRKRAADECLPRLCRSHPLDPTGAGLLPEFCHHGYLDRKDARLYDINDVISLTRRWGFTGRP